MIRLQAIPYIVKRMDARQRWGMAQVYFCRCQDH